MPTTYGFSNRLQLTGVSDDGSTLMWTGHTGPGFGSNVTDQNDDGNLDIGVDSYIAGSILYTGYIIQVNGNDYAVFSDGGNYYIPYNATPDDLVAEMPSSGSTSGKTDNATPQNFCFLQGTMIATPSGERPVEALNIGALILTSDGRQVPVKWIGRQEVRTPLNRALPDRLAPVCIAARALGNHSDLCVSADHGILIDGLVINAAALVNHDTIRFLPGSDLTNPFIYYHIETNAHDVILANGVPVETFIDVAGRAAFDNYAEYLSLYGVERIIPEMKRPRISSPRMLPPAIRQRLGIEIADSRQVLAG